MNRKSAVLTLSIGIACAIVAVALALDLGGISSVLPIAAKGVWGFAGCAAALLALYAFEQISTAGVLTIIAVEVVASIVYFAQIARMQRIM